MGPLQVRFASLADEAVCRRLDKHLPSAALRHKLGDQELLVGEMDGDAVAYLRLEYLWGKMPYIGLVWVADSMRGQGIGRGLVAFLAEYLRGCGHRMLLSSSQVDEAAPQAWHRAVGFRECGLIAGINDDGIGELFFRMDL